MSFKGNAVEYAATTNDTSAPPGGTFTWSEENRTETSKPILLFKGRFTSAWAKKQSVSSDGGGQEGVRGPLGLRLLRHSPEPLIDLVFVHGLRGGSIKTWRKGSDPRNFWPKFWLSLEPGLQNANIHSFGYDSDWASTKPSFLDIHDFGQSLLEEMRNSPYLRDDKKRPILLLGHSMGGLVIKKAFILAKDVPDFQERIRCIFFLATPHKGSDYAALLNNILAISGVLSPRHYITDLVAGSTSAQLINEEFERHASELPVFSFYETLRMGIGISSFLIVNRSSAILGSGFKKQRVQYLNANHRDICKFDNPDDPNYITLKNAITSATQDVLKEVIQSKIKESKEQMMLLKAYLGISNSPDEYYPRAEGTCKWIDDRDDFQDWRDSAESEDAPETARSPSVFLVYANPGTGKTFLAAHVKEELCQFQLECASHFFHVGNNTSHTLESFMRSIAYQMASLNASIREKLLELCSEQPIFDKDDIWAIWTKIFKRGIFQARIHTPQYWVIDAMDECSRYRDFFTMIKGIQLSFPLHIFITSRKLSDMSHLARSLEPSASITSIEIKSEDTVRDIECYIQTRIGDRPIDAIANKNDLVSNLLLRSNACFLWVKLVLDELEQVYSNESVLEVLHDIPGTMIPYYERAIRAMAEKKREKNIAKALLVWVVASTRKLLASELSNALKLDINAELPNARNAVEGLCGQMVSVNHHSGVVDLVHSTVREFLLSEAAAEFTISMPEAHERIAITCLQLLCSSEMQPPRSQRQLTSQHAKTQEPEPSPLLDYAIRQFSEHVYLASSATDELLPSLDRFFERNVLRWIEKVTHHGDLHLLIRLSKHLKSYLNRRSKYRPTLIVEAQNLEAWSTDLSMIVTKFGPALIQKPSSIYILIPPLCPSGSAIYQRFGKRPDGLTVVGHVESAWDECITSVSFGEDTIPTTVSCGEDLIAVGMLSGEISLYDHRSCQRVGGVVEGKRPLDVVHLTDKLIAMTTTKEIILMDRESKILWQTCLQFRCMLLTSTPQAIIAVSQPGHVLKWDISTGVLLEDQTFSYMCLDDEGEIVSRLKAPHVATLSSNADLLTLGYSDGTVCLWEVSSGEVICWARDDKNRAVSALLFNPNPIIDMLLVIYSDHSLALYETWSGGLVKNRKPPSDNTGVMSAACSRDGRTLATVDNSGFLRIWDFESLTLLYHILIPYAPFRIINFTPDGLGVVDITYSGMCVCAPATLVRRNNGENQSCSEDEVNLPPIEGACEIRRASKITALCAHPSLPIVFAGKQDGQILAFSTKTGSQISHLYTHAHGASISRFAIGKNNLLASGDTNDRLQVWKLGSGQLSTFEHKTLVFQLQLRVRAVQLCFSEQGDHLLVSTENCDTVYCTEDGSCVGTLQFSARERKVWRWLAAPTSQDQKDEFCLVMDHTMVKYSTHEFPERVTDSQVQLNYSVEDGTKAVKIDSAVICPNTQTLALSIRHASGLVTSSALFLFDLTKLVSSGSIDEVPSLTPICGLLSKNCKQFIGINERTKSFVFLHQNSWICSISPDGLSEGGFTQHFFVPNEYVSANDEVLPTKTADNGICFCLHGGLAIVRNGFNFREPRVLT